MKPPPTCRECAVPMVASNEEVGADQVRHCGRGLCGVCYREHLKRGDLDTFPTLGHAGRKVSCLSVLEDYLLVTGCLCRCHINGFRHPHGTGCHCNAQAAAERLGMTLPALKQALYRAARRVP